MSKLLINEEPLQVLPSLAAKIGLNEAIVLQQIHYWLRRSKHIFDGKVWIYNTFKGWHEQFPWWSERTIKRVIDNLRQDGLIETTSQYNQKKMDQTLWYTIHYDKIDDPALTGTGLCAQNDKLSLSTGTGCHTQNDKLAPSIVTDCQPQSDNLASSLPEADSDKLSPPIPREDQENTNKRGKRRGAAQLPPASLPDDIPVDEPHPHKVNMFGVICDCVGIDTRIITEKQRGQVAQAAKVLSEAGYTVTDLMAFRKYWFTQDWRGSKRHEWPTLSQLREELGKVKAIPYLPAAADPPSPNGGGVGVAVGTVIGKVVNLP